MTYCLVGTLQARDSTARYRRHFILRIDTLSDAPVVRCKCPTAEHLRHAALLQYKVWRILERQNAANHWQASVEL